MPRHLCQTDEKIARLTDKYVRNILILDMSIERTRHSIPLLVEMLRHHCEHARHLEYQRTWFLVSYVVGVSTILSQTYDKPDVMSWLLFVLVAPTIIGLLITIRWGISFEVHRKRINTIIKILKLEYISSGLKKEYLGFDITSKEKPSLFDFTIKINTWEIRLFSTRALFIWFYGVILLAFLIGGIYYSFLA